MSEDEIIDIAEKIANFGWSDYDDFEKNKQAIQGLLDLYQKEKEKNKELSEKVTQNICNRVEAEVLEEYRLKVQNSISKDKIKEKIEELEAMSISKDIYYDDILKMLQELLEERN